MDGSEIWRSTKHYSGYGHADLDSDGTLYIGADSTIYALDSKTGQQKGILKTQGSICSDPVIGRDGSVYASSGNSFMYALDGKTGEINWAFEANQWESRSAAIGSDGTVYYERTIIPFTH